MQEQVIYLGRMIRSKREWRCTNCSAVQIKWSGSCYKCKRAGTMQEITLIPNNKPTASLTQKALGRRSKNSERSIAKRMTAIDGADPQYAKIATSTGRIGHITNIRADAISRTYLTENKNRKLPAWFTAAWLLINQRAEDFGKNALLHLDPPNMPKEFPLNGTIRKLDTMAVITQTRHEHLIVTEKNLSEIKVIMDLKISNAAKLQQIREILGI